MGFGGKWELKDQEGYEEFMRLMQVPEQYIQMGKNAPVSLLIEEEGDKFSIQTTTGPQSWTDQFELGKPATITGPGKHQMPTIVTRDGNTLVGTYEVPNAKIRACRQLEGDILYDVYHQLSPFCLPRWRLFVRRDGMVKRRWFNSQGVRLNNALQGQLFIQRDIMDGIILWQ